MDLTLPLLSLFLFGLLVVFWQAIFAWLVNDLHPFFEKRYPSLAKYVKNAYMVLDKTMTEATHTAYAAWQKTTNVLAVQTISFSKKAGNLEAELVTYTSDNPYLENAKYDQRTSKKTLTEEEVKNLPDDIKRDLHQGETHIVDIVEQRYQEFEKLGYVRCQNKWDKKNE